MLTGEPMLFIEGSSCVPVGHSIWPAFIFIPQFSFEICIFFYHPVAAVVGIGVAADAAAGEVDDVGPATDGLADGGGGPRVSSW